jgi:soluble lytic murein transglycosylase
MKRILVAFALLIALAAGGLYLFNRYWTRRFDALIERQARIYRHDPALIWSVIYQETYFKPWIIGGAGEIGLMQITPAVAREWAQATGFKEFTEQAARDPQGVLSDPERNLQIGCWYLEKLREQYRDLPGAEARMLAAYNAGPSRVAEWNQTGNARPANEEDFIGRIGIPSTKIYVSEILARYRALKADAANK